MIASDFLSTPNEQNEGNEQTSHLGCDGQPVVGNCSSSSFCSSFVSRNPAGDALLEMWRIGLNRMRGHSPPQGFTERDWRQWKLDALALFAAHGPRAATLGWRTEELFGLDRNCPATRVGASGVARFTHGGSIVELTHNYARIQRQTGAVLTYRRTGPQPGAVPAWELNPPVGDNMTDYTMDFDAGHGEAGPWLTWHAAPSRDGAHAAGTWSVKDSATRTVVDLTRGLVVDWPNSQTGWIQSGGVSGVPPQKRWNESRAKFEPSPGEDWKRGMRVPVAFLLNGTPVYAVWEQNSVAAFRGYCDLMALLKETAARELPKLPLLIFTGPRQVRLGSAEIPVPQFRPERYVDRPKCLPDGDTINPPSSDGWNGSMAPSASPTLSGSHSAAGPAQTAGAVAAVGTGTSSDELLMDDEVPW